MARGAWYARMAMGMAIAGAIAALLPALAMWGFTVDDALIPLRYAHHLASGMGYHFNPHGPVTDGVTPLPWAPLLVPVTLGTGSDLMVALGRVKAVGVVAWAAAASVLGHALVAGARERPDIVHAVTALVVVGLAFPLGAWSASGMETGIATALATLAATSFERRPRATGILAGLVATLRPEMVPWALALAAGAALAASRSPLRGASSRIRAVLTTVAFAIGPFALCVLVRIAAFGRPAPLALSAKPSDLSHGIAYVAAASVVVLTPFFCAAPVALMRASPRAKTLAIAAVVHAIVVVGVGGDWMPYARLMVPIAPSLALVHVDVSRVAHWAATAARSTTAIVLGILLARTAAPAGRTVYADRNDLVVGARPVLASAQRIAALDIGWVGAAAPHAEIVDLAGLTDPDIAALRGGHTSKAVDLAMLLDRHVDTLVIYGEPRTVELRITRGSPRFFADRFEIATDVPFGSRGAHYVFYRRRPYE